jgi:hypothetical protein
MASYAPDYTPRFHLKYRAAGFDHTLQLRGARGDTAASLIANQQAAAVDILNAGATAGLMANDYAWLAAEYALTDSNVFIPTPLVGVSVAGTVNMALHAKRKRARGLTWAGRAVGSHARFTVFGLVIASEDAGDVGADAIITEAELAFIGTVAGAGDSFARAGSGQAASFYRRATYKENDHLLALIKRGG